MNFGSSKLVCPSQSPLVLEDITLSFISNLILTTPTSLLEQTLSQSNLNLTPSLTEQVLSRLQNASILSYRFFHWAHLKNPNPNPNLPLPCGPLSPPRSATPSSTPGGTDDDDDEWMLMP